MVTGSILGGTLHFVSFAPGRIIVCGDSAIHDPNGPVGAFVPKVYQAGARTVVGISGATVLPRTGVGLPEVVGHLCADVALHDKPDELLSAIRVRVPPLMLAEAERGTRFPEGFEFACYIIRRSIFGVVDALHLEIPVIGDLGEPHIEPILTRQILSAAWYFSLGQSDALPAESQDAVCKELSDPGLSDESILSVLERLFNAASQATGGKVGGPLDIVALDSAGIRWLRKNGPLSMVVPPDRVAEFEEKLKARGLRYQKSPGVG